MFSDRENSEKLNFLMSLLLIPSGKGPFLILKMANHGLLGQDEAPVEKTKRNGEKICIEELLRIKFGLRKVLTQVILVYSSFQREKMVEKKIKIFP